MSNLFDALKNLGYSNDVCLVLDKALSLRGVTVDLLLKATSDDDRMRALGDFTVGVAKSMLGASLDPAAVARASVKDNVVLTSVVSTILFELTTMVMMITDGDFDKSHDMLSHILKVCLQESALIIAEYKDIKDDGEESTESSVLH